MRKLKIFTYDKNFVVEYVQSNLIIRILLVFILLSKKTKYILCCYKLLKKHCENVIKKLLCTCTLFAKHCYNLPFPKNTISTKIIDT